MLTPADIRDCPEAVTTAGRTRDFVAERTSLSWHDGRRFIDMNKPFGAIEYLEVCDLMALAEYFEVVYGLMNVRRPTMEESPTAWASEVDRLLAAMHL